MMLGDILRAEGQHAGLRKQQLKATPVGESVEDKHHNELAAAIAKRREMLKNVPFVPKKEDPEKKSELQNTILQGIASLRKVPNRRASMDKPKGTRPLADPSAPKSKWTPKPATSGSSRMDDDMSFAKFRCEYCRQPITNMECMDTQNGMFHPDCFMCASCRRPLVGEYLTVSGNFFHPECLNCCKCLNSLINEPLLCSDKKLYCAKDSPRDLCAGCSERIEEGRVIQLEERGWHEKCFVCTECREPLAGKMYITHNHHYYCKPDYTRLFAIKCSRCGLEADGPCFKVSAPDGDQLTLHQKCYTCATCSTMLRGKGSFAYLGDVYCKTHYDAVQASSS